MNKYQLLVTAVVVSFLLGSAGNTSAQQKAPKPPPPGSQGQQGPATGGSSPQLLPLCPTGWHVAGKYDPANFTCVPNTPAKITCPPGSQYFEEKGPSGAVCDFGCNPTTMPK